MTTQNMILHGGIFSIVLIPMCKGRTEDVVIRNMDAKEYEVAVALTSPGFRTAGVGMIPKNEGRSLRLASNVFEDKPWDLIVWKRQNHSATWTFSTAFRIPNKSLSSTMGIEPSKDRVSFLYSTPGPPEGPPRVYPPIQPWGENDAGLADSQAPPNLRVQLGVSAYKCETGIHISSVTSGTPATRCFDIQTGQTVRLEAGDHIVSVNGIVPGDIPEFQKLISTSPQTINLVVLDGRSKETRRFSTKLW